jgi:hypothetical protein
MTRSKTPPTIANAFRNADYEAELARLQRTAITGGGGSGTPGPQGPQGPAGATGATGPAGPGVAAGGTLNQILAKASAVDYATKWVDPASGGAPPEVLVGPDQPTGTEVLWIDTDDPSWPGPPTFVAVLPTTNLIDGQQVFFQTAAMAAANVPPWHLRYRAGISDAYKWEVIAAQPLRTYFSGQQDASTAVYADVPATSIAVPLGGYYTHQAIIYAYNNTAGGYGVGNVKYAAIAETSAHEIIVTTQTPLTVPGMSYAPLLVPFGSVVIGRWRMVTSGIARLYSFNLAVTPARVG